MDPSTGSMTTRRGRVALGMFCILLATYVVNAMDRQLFPILASDVRKALSLSLPEVGLAATIFTLGMGLAGLPTAYLLRRLRRKDVAMLGLALFSLATLLTALVRDLPSLLLIRFLSGIGEGLQFAAILAIGATYFARHRALAASSLNFTFGAGAIIGPNLGAALLGAGDWRLPFVAFGLAGAPALAVTALAVRSWFSEAAAAHQPADMKAEVGAGIPRLAVILSAATVLTGLTIYGYLALYPTYLREELGFSPAQAALAASTFGLGALVSLVGGWVGDRLDFRKVLFCSFVAAAILGSLLFAGLRTPLSWHVAGSFLFGASVSGFGYANLSAGIIKAMGPHRTAQASGLFITALYVPAAFAGYLLGALKDAFGWSHAAMLQLGGGAALAALLCVLAMRLGKSDSGAGPLEES